MYLAHDLKTPLSSVVGYLSLLRDETEISQELRRKYLLIALEKALRLEDLINEFFEITRFNLSHITLEYQRIDLTLLLQQLIFEFQPMLKQNALTCTLHAPDSILLQCDGNKMQRVFDNLLRNGVIYSFPDTEITITAEVHENTVSICFSNYGEQIPEEKLEQIFQQFYRLDPARGTAKSGAGLGLAIAKQIVSLHKGSINAKSQNGLTTFTVSLPLS